MKRLSFAIVLVLALAVRLAAAAEYTVPGHGVLVLPVPENWLGQTRSTENPPAAGIRFRPPAGDAFEVQVTAIWVPPARLASINADILKGMAEKAAQKALTAAAETEVKVAELGGASAGFHFSITDRGNPTGPGNYKYMTQGNVLVGELLTVFTIFYRDAASPVRDDALRMLASATYTKTSATAGRRDALQVEETALGYELSVPVSRLVLAIPKGHLSREGRPSGGSIDNPRYFYFQDPAAGMIVSGWFEPEQRFSGAQDVWESDTAAWRKRSLPEPKQVVFTKVDRWDVVVYDLATPNGATHSHVRAHWVQGGTWIDMHASIVGRGTSEKYRADLLEFLRTLQVRERK